MFRRGGRSEDDFADEVRSHLDHEADRLVAEGLTRDAARREALMRFGDVRAARERFRASAARTWPECATREVRFALRSLRRDPVFALATVVTLALGTGGVTAMFSVIRGVLLKPLAYAESEALALVWSSQPARGLDTSPVSLPDLADWRAQARAFTGMGGFVFAELGFAGDGEPEDVVGAAVTPGFFEAIAVLPLLGRTLTEEEGVWGGRRVVVLGESLWRERGTSSRLYLVVRTAGDPMALAGAIPAAVAAIDPAQAVRSVAPMEQIIADRLGQPRFRTLVLAAFAGLALLMAAVGLYGVLAFSVAERTREIGIRVALGADSGDVLGLVVGRGLALAGAGTAIGLAAALALTRLLSGLLFDVTPGDPVTFAGIAVLLLAVATLATWLPARRAAALDPVEALRS